VPAVVDQELSVEYGFVDLMSGDRRVEELLAARGGQVNGLCGATYPGALSMMTGRHTGDVPFTVSITQDEPPLGGEWEDVVEVSFEAAGVDCVLLTFDDAAELTLPAATCFRARYCALGMDDADRGGVRSADEPVVDRYLLQLWPAPTMRPDAVLRQTSEFAAYWHDVARATPPPPSPPSPVERAAAQAKEKAKRARKAVAAEKRMMKARWGGSLPTEALLAGGAPAEELASSHRALADGIVSLSPDDLRQVAIWAAVTACERAGKTVIDWEPALDALRERRPLPPPLDEPTRAWTLLFGPMQLLAVLPEDTPVPLNIHPAAAALATVLAAADPTPPSQPSTGSGRPPAGTTIPSCSCRRCNRGSG